MVELKEAVEAAQADLRVIQAEGTVAVALVAPLGMLSGVLSSLPEGGDAPILLAKSACEALADCASEVGKADEAVAEQLRGIVRRLSPAVAVLLHPDPAPEDMPGWLVPRSVPSGWDCIE